MWAQPGMVVRHNGKNLLFPISEVEYVLFAEDLSEYSGYVDLGLPSGTLWAKCNIGAENPEDYGNYYAWGETKPKSDYSWGTYIHCNGTNDSMTKYCTYGAYGTIDGLTMLLPEDDAALANRGDSWYIPTNTQFEELLNSSYTTREWTNVGGKNGWKITSRQNGKSIFLPAAGHYEGTSCSSPGDLGYYWSSSLGASGANRSYDLLFYSDGIYTATGDRCYGQSIRPVSDKHESVDLGLPSGTLWATCNVGANSPEEYGDHFAWGETKPKDDYSWATYEYCKGTENTLTKYCYEYELGYNGFTDDLTDLLPEDDAATANWGSRWQMPSMDQLRELYEDTSWTWTQQNGVNGILFTGSNGNTLFLPAAGLRSDSNYYAAGSSCFYWSGSLIMSAQFSHGAFCLDFESGSCYPSGVSRNYGQSVRPVRKK